MRLKARSLFVAVLMAAALIGAYAAGASGRQDKKPDLRVFELRIYTPAPGKMPALLSRFRDHTRRLFEKHGIVNIGYWVTTDAKDAVNGEARLYYIVAHKSRESVGQSFRAFGMDPEWQAARTESEKNGPLVAKLESIFMSPTDFSAIK